MKTFERLKKRLENEYGITAYDFKRTRAGKRMKKSGAFVWEARINCVKTIGSCDTATDCVNAPKLSFISGHFGEVEVCAELR